MGKEEDPTVAKGEEQVTGKEEEADHRYGVPHLGPRMLMWRSLVELSWDAQCGALVSERGVSAAGLSGQVDHQLAVFRDCDPAELTQAELSCCAGLVVRPSELCRPGWVGGLACDLSPSPTRPSLSDPRSSLCPTASAYTLLAGHFALPARARPELHTRLRIQQNWLQALLPLV